jgi:hypothetical protein
VFVMEILGHSQISVTVNTYSHVKPASSREPVVWWRACVLLAYRRVCARPFDHHPGLRARPAWASSGSTLAVPASWLVVGSTR